MYISFNKLKYLMKYIDDTSDEEYSRIYDYVLTKYISQWYYLYGYKIWNLIFHI